MATSSASARRHGWSAWLAGALVGLVVFLTPLVILETLADHPPEIRVTSTGQRFSALVVSGDQSILLMNSMRPDEAISALGRLRRPWEPRPSIVIAPATDDAAPGLIEAIHLLDAERVVIAGLPGADPSWSRIERLCREREIELVFLDDYMRIDAGSISLSILAPGSQGDGLSELIISRNGLQVAIGMGPQVPRTLAQIAVLNGDVQVASSIGPVVVQGSWAEQNLGGGSRLSVENQEVVTVLLEEDRLRVKGGQVVSAK